MLLQQMSACLNEQFLGSFAGKAELFWSLTYEQKFDQVGLIFRPFVMEGDDPPECPWVAEKIKTDT